MKCFSNTETITSSLLVYLEKAAESAEPVDLAALTTYIAFDAVCEAAFGYQLNAVSGSEEGKRLHLCLRSLVDAQAGKGIYANLQERKVSAEELTNAQVTWRTFLAKLLAVIRSDSEQYRAKNGALDIERNFGHALIQLSVTDETYGDAQLTSEIHQVVEVEYMIVSTYENELEKQKLSKSLVVTYDIVGMTYFSYH